MFSKETFRALTYCARAIASIKRLEILERPTTAYIISSSPFLLAHSLITIDPNRRHCLVSLGKLSYASARKFTWLSWVELNYPSVFLRTVRIVSAALAHRIEGLVGSGKPAATIFPHSVFRVQPTKFLHQCVVLY